MLISISWTHQDVLASWSNPLSANPEKWSNTLKHIVGNLPTICLSVFDHYMNLALKGLKATHEQQKEPDYLKNNLFSKSLDYFWNVCKKLLEKNVISRSSLS